MSTSRSIVTAAGDFTGGSALQYVSTAASAGPEFVLDLRGITSVDVVAGVALGALLERFPRCDVWEPASSQPRELLCGLLERYPQIDSSSGRVPVEQILLPARPFATLDECCVTADALCATKTTRRVVSFAAALLVMLVDNALRHAVDALVDPVAAVLQSRDENELSVAVRDSGAGLPEGAKAVALLRQPRLAQSAGEQRVRRHPALASLPRWATHLGFDLSFSFWSGETRVTRRSGRWSSNRMPRISGSAALIVVRIPPA